MIPNLSPLQWLVLVAFLFFYGFAVFAVTRDYYLRHPPRPASASVGAAHGMSADETRQLGQRLRQSLDDGDSGPGAEAMSSDPEVLATQANRLFAARRFDAAIVLYRQILSLQPDNADARNDLGLALHYAGDSEQGFETLQQGVEQAPSSQRMWLSLGFVALQIGSESVAVDALTTAEQLDPESDIGAEATRLLGLVESGAGG